MGCLIIPEPGDPTGFPPSIVVAIKALACELPSRLGVPVSRFSREDLKRLVVEHGIVATISGITIWRWLSKDAIKPWQYRTWLFPRDPAFAGKAWPILDLYQKQWMGIPLGPRDYVISTDEKTSIQARKRGSSPISVKGTELSECPRSEIVEVPVSECHAHHGSQCAIHYRTVFWVLVSRPLRAFFCGF
jgi:hypothetical protein